MPTTIKECKCVSEFQDKTYGKNQRLFNVIKDDKGGKCSVCGTVKIFNIPTK